MSISRLFELLVLIQQKDVFIVLEYRKRHLPVLYYLPKKVGKWPFLNPFGKMSISRLFEHRVFIPQRGVFSFQNILKDIVLAIISSKKKLEKSPFLDQNHKLTPLKNFNFSTFELLVFIAQKGVFFVLAYRKRPLSGLYCLKKKKNRKMAIFGPKPWVDPFEKI